MAGFGDALSILGDAQQSRPDISTTPEGRPHIFIYPREAQTKSGDFGSALGILSNTDTPAPRSSQSQPHDIGAVESFRTGLKSGLTANFSDEILGASAAGKTMLPEGVNPKLSPLGEIISAAGGAMRLGYEAIAGRGAGTQAYEQARDAERENQRLASEQHPIANLAGNVAGAVALPVGGAASAITMPARMGVGGVLGAAYGGAYGAGEGTNLEDRANRAASGALIGGAAGAAAPPVMSGLAAAGRGISGAVGTVLGHPIETARAGLDVNAEAARRVGNNILADIKTGGGGMTAADLAAARASGQPTSIIDVGGEHTRDLARSAANTSPAARSALDEMAGTRFEDQSTRTADFIKGLIPTAGNATRTQEAIDAAERAANKGGYARAYSAGDRSINSPELERLMGSPDVVAAMKKAVESGKSRAIADGMGGFNSTVKVTDDGRVIFNKGPGGVPTYPNLQFWDYTYRNLRDAGQAAFRAGRNDEGSYLSSLSKQLRSDLDNAVPEYAKARGVASEFFQAENALEAGQKFVSMRGPIEEARIAHAKMTPTQKAMFAEGFVSDLTDKISKIPNNRSVTIDRIFNSPDGKARIELALGKDKADDLQYFLRRENMMDLARTAIRGNSTTVRQLIQSGVAGGIGAAAGGAAEAALTGNMDAKSILSAALVGGAAAGHRAINFNVARRVGEMLASNDPAVLRTAIKMAKTNPDAGRAVVRGEQFLEKLIGQRAGDASPIISTGMVPVRADQQQNNQLQ